MLGCLIGDDNDDDDDVNVTCAVFAVKWVCYGGGSSRGSGSSDWSRTNNHFKCFVKG